MRGPWHPATPRCRYGSLPARTRVLRHLRRSGARIQLPLRWQRCITSQPAVGRCRGRRGLDAEGGTGLRKNHNDSLRPWATATSSPQTTQCIHNGEWPHNWDASHPNRHLRDAAASANRHQTGVPRLTATAVAILCLSFDNKLVKRRAPCRSRVRLAVSLPGVGKARHG
jgi:hypothetical protein